MKDKAKADKPMTFEAALTRFKGVQTNAKKYARMCSELAIVHFHEHGDLSQCQKFHDAIDRNFGRPVAFLLWLAKFSPVNIEKGHLTKDVSPDAKPFDLEGAMKEPYWESEPNKEQITFSSDDVVVNLNRVIKRHESSRYEAADEAATAKLNEAKVAVAAL